jgi:hypothetical protein
MIFGGKKGTWANLGGDWVDISSKEALDEYHDVYSWMMNFILVIGGLGFALLLLFDPSYVNTDGNKEVGGIIGGFVVAFIGILCMCSRKIHRIFWWTVFIAAVCFVIWLLFFWKR